MVVRWSSNHGDHPDDQNDLQFIKILSKSYVWCSNIKTATDDCQIWNARSPKKWKVCLKLSYTVSMTLPGTSNLFRRKNFDLLLFPRTVCQKIFELFMVDSSKKVVRLKISLPSSDLQNRQCKVQKWFVTYKSWAKIF